MSLTPEYEADIRSKVNPIYRDQLGTESHERAMLLSEIDRLRAEVAELRKDAERYRWLRSQHWNDSGMCVVMHPKSAVKLGHQCPSDDRLDAAIDAALAKDSSHE